MIKLLEAKKQFPAIKKDAWNPFFKANYASLNNILDAIEPVLEKHGLYIRSILKDNILITQICELETGNVNLESCFNLPVLNDIQKIGSAITYARRYNLVAMLNLNIENDDDGNATKETPKAETKTTPKQSTAYQNALKAVNSATDLAMMRDKINESTKLTTTEKDALHKLINERIKKQNG